MKPLASPEEGDEEDEEDEDEEDCKGAQRFDEENREFDDDDDDDDGGGDIWTVPAAIDTRPRTSSWILFIRVYGSLYLHTS